MISLWMMGVSNFIETFSVNIPCSGHIRTQVSAMHAPAVRAHSQKIQQEQGSLSSRRSRRRFHYAHQGITG